MSNLKGRDFLSITDLTKDEIKEVLKLAKKFKNNKIEINAKKNLGLLFYKASTRTRVSFTVAMAKLGGDVLDLNPSRTQVGRGEPIQDTARVLDRYLDILAIRTFAHEDLQTFADYSDVPIINALTDLEHPCQILADLLTIKENFGSFSGLTLTYLGDGNNVANSLLLGCVLMGMNFHIATPENYALQGDIVAQAKKLATHPEQILITTNPVEAVRNSQVIYTDVWASMGQEDEAEQRFPVFQPYQVNRELVNHAHQDAIILHCLPAHREEEITEEMLESSQSQVWNQAENRMHVQQALIALLLGLV